MQTDSIETDIVRIFSERARSLPLEDYASLCDTLAEHFQTCAIAAYKDMRREENESS